MDGKAAGRGVNEFMRELTVGDLDLSRACTLPPTRGGPLQPCSLPHYAEIAELVAGEVLDSGCGSALPLRMPRSRGQGGAGRGTYLGRVGGPG